MAEGFLRHYGKKEFESYSAGTNPGFLHPLTAAVMSEVGVDISHQKSESIDEYIDMDFDYVITVCSRAEENCPVFPGCAKGLHWTIPDPAGAAGSESDIMNVFRSVRDEIDKRVMNFISETS